MRGVQGRAPENQISARLRETVTIRGSTDITDTGMYFLDKEIYALAVFADLPASLKITLDIPDDLFVFDIWGRLEDAAGLIKSLDTYTYDDSTQEITFSGASSGDLVEAIVLLIETKPSSA